MNNCIKKNRCTKINPNNKDFVQEIGKIKTDLELVNQTKPRAQIKSESLSIDHPENTYSHKISLFCLKKKCKLLLK